MEPVVLADVNKTKCVLVCDTREMHVTRHETELANVNIVRKQVTIGDYSVLTPTNNILAVIERKSLDDFAASLKDGRHCNKQKMIDLRALTGCRILYIIEGPEFPAPNTCFQNIPYAFIESSIFHLAVRDGIAILRSKDSLETAKMLARFMASMDTLVTRDGITDNKIGGEPTLDQILDKPVVNLADTIATLTAKIPTTPSDIVREMWSCFPGISVESASEYMKYWSIADIICEKIPREDITKFKLSSGRKIGKKAVESLSAPGKMVEIRLLQAIPGISKNMAATMLDKTPLKRLLSYGIEISIEIVGKNSRRLGDKNAENVVKYFNYKTPHIDVVEQK